VIKSVRAALLAREGEFERAVSLARDALAVAERSEHIEGAWLRGSAWKCVIPGNESGF